MGKPRKVLIALTDVGLPMVEGVPVNNTVEEALGCYVALEEQGMEPWLMCDLPETSGRYRACGRDTDVNNFDELLLNREVPNFYGGDVNRRHLWTVRSICAFKGQLSYFFCDPEMARGEYISYVLQKFYGGDTGNLKPSGKLTSENSVYDTFEKREKLLPRAMLQDNLHKTRKANMLVRSAYPIRNHPIHSRFPNVEFIDSWRSHLFRVRPETDDPVKNGLTDMLKSTCYVGSLKPARHKRLVELGIFTPEAEDSGIIKYYGKCARPLDEMRGKPPVRFGGAHGRVVLSDVNNSYLNHISSLVLGHAHQRSTGISHRYLQGLLVGRSMLVDAEQDPNGLYLHGNAARQHWLKDHIYFSSPGELIEKLEWSRVPAHFDTLVDELEVQRVMIEEESRDDMLKRLNQ